MASMTSQLAALILPLRSLFEPLLDRISSLEALEYLFYRYGWRVTLDDTAFAAIITGVLIGVAFWAIYAAGVSTLRADYQRAKQTRRIS